MKLIFQRNGVDEFEIQAGEFDSLLEIKAKVERMQGIPIVKQILSVNGNTLIDDFDLVCHEIQDGSRIHLDVAADPPQEMTISLKMPKPLYTMNLEVNAHGTILQLKEAIQAMAKIPIHRIVITIEDGVELLDCMKVQEIQSVTESDVTVEFLPSRSSTSHPPPPTTPTPTSSSSSQYPPPPTTPTPTSSSSSHPPPPTTPTPTSSSSSSHPPPPTSPTPTSSSSQYRPPLIPPAPTWLSSHSPTAALMPPPTKMRLELRHGDHRMMVEVWAEHKVQDLRTKLGRMKMPAEYFFVHFRAGYTILKEELSFKQQNVGSGDVIQIYAVGAPRK